MVTQKTSRSEVCARAIPPHPPGPPSELRNMVEVARWRAQISPHEKVFAFLDDGERETSSLTYRQLDERARVLAAGLQEQGARGEQVLLLSMPGEDFVTSFYGCLYAGAVPVPAYPPDPMRLQRTIPRLEAIVKDAGASFVVGSAETIKLMPQGLGNAPQHTLALPQLESGDGSRWAPPRVLEHDVALLQYTSGSTAEPRGVMVTHSNIMHCLDTMHCDDPQVGVCWLPPYHDMGLVGGVLLPVYTGSLVVVMSPLAFLERPVRWLLAISRYRAKTTIGPNFGYELCVRKTRSDDCEGLDLSSWSIAVVGAEPVRATTIEGFVEKFAPYGFRRETFMPAYGLAEAVLNVTASHYREPPIINAFSQDALAENRACPVSAEAPNARPLVACGRSWPGQRLAIVDPETRLALEPDQVGEIWFQSPTVTAGYWNRPDETKQVFAARLADDCHASDDGTAESLTLASPAGGESGVRGFLRTGDLGFLHDGYLYVTGRLKELMIFAGRNYYPQDIEEVVAGSHPSLRADAGAAFTCEIEGEDRLIVVQEARRSDRYSFDEVIAAVCRDVTAAFLISPYAVALIAGGTMPKTSSGKIQRRACRDLFLNGELKLLAEWRMPTSHVSPRTPLEAEIAAVWSEVLGIDRIGVHDNFFALGGQSVMVMQIYVRLRHLLPFELPIETVFEKPTIAGLADLIMTAGLEEQNVDMAVLLQEIEGLSEEEARCRTQSNT